MTGFEIDTDRSVDNVISPSPLVGWQAFHPEYFPVGRDGVSVVDGNADHQARALQGLQIESGELQSSFIA